MSWYITKGTLEDVASLIQARRFEVLRDYILDNSTATPTPDEVKSIAGCNRLDWDGDNTFQWAVGRSGTQYGCELITWRPGNYVRLYVEGANSDGDWENSRGDFPSMVQAQTLAQHIENRSITAEDRAWLVIRHYGLAADTPEELVDEA
jgi:hypothetical protein